MSIPAPIARAVRRATNTFLLNSLDVRRRALKLDPLEVLIFNTVLAANLQHLPADRRQGLDDPELDDERHPVSIEGVAAALGVSGETIRRKLKRLQSQGLIERVGAVEGPGTERTGLAAGLAAGLPILEQPSVRQALGLELSQLWRLLLTLERLGLITLHRRANWERPRDEAVMQPCRRAETAIASAG